MANTACFMIVARNDIPIYEAEVGSAAKREDAAQLHQFILHAALDVVQDLAWTTSAMFLKSVDRFNDLILLNPLYLPGSRVTSTHFDTKISLLRVSFAIIRGNLCALRNIDSMSFTSAASDLCRG
ncbi:hypothetical protein HA466_0118020 [Hirschfeldia incana]|nr:hypothetical protein HA466_0118020 [Hirschfeldia incana]